METGKPKRVVRRRPRGEGSITHEGDRWIVRLWVGARRLKRVCRSQGDALKALDELKRRAALGVPLTRYTVGDCLDDFLAHGENSRGWAPSTTASYESAARVHIRPALGKRMLADLAVADVQRLMAAMLEDGQSPRYVAHVRAVLRAAIGHAVQGEIMHRNVAALARPPMLRREEMRALSGDETRRLFAALDDERLRALIITATTLGLRRGELIALRWSDVDLDAATLTVRRTGKRIKGQYVEGQPKSERSRRAIALPPALVTLLRRQSAAVAADRLRLGPGWQDEDRVFPGAGGGPTGENTIRKALDRALAKAKITGHVRIHDLRHTAATALLAAGGDLRDVQEMLGHASYALTADTYAHVLDDQRKATASRIETALGAAIVGA